MRIRSVEIVFQDDLSACADTTLLDSSLDLAASDDSTECADDLDPLPDNSITLNAEGDLSDDASASLPRDDDVRTPEPTSRDEDVRTPEPTSRDVDDSVQAPSDCATSAIEDVTLSLDACGTSEVVDSGRFTEDASSSHLETAPLLAYEDALLSQSFDAIAVDDTATEVDVVHLVEPAAALGRLYEYIDSEDSDSSSTARCEAPPPAHLTPFPDPITPDDHTLCDGSDLQYDSFIDMGKF